MRIYLLPFFLSLVSCSIQKMALRSATPVLVNASDGMMKEGNWRFFKDSAPGNIKFMEVLWEQDKSNLGFLSALVKSYAGYSFAIAETLALEEELSGREDARWKREAIVYYTRSLDYGLRYLKEAGEAAGVPVITELMDESQMSEVLEYADIIQIGSRNMYNYSLLKAVGQINKPVLLKRGMSATIKEWIMAAEYIAMSGNRNILLCERGIRTYDNYTRNTLDIAAVPIMQMETGLPVIVDPSHGTGKRNLIAPMCRAGIAAGASGLMVEVHYKPDEALCDGPQSLTPEAYHQIIDSILKG